MTETRDLIDAIKEALLSQGIIDNRIERICAANTNYTDYELMQNIANELFININLHHEDIVVTINSPHQLTTIDLALDEHYHPLYLVNGFSS